MIRALVSGLLLWIAITPSSAQKVRSIQLSEAILLAAVDRPGDFYTVSTTGQIQRFDKNGKLDILYKKEPPPTVFDPRDGARIFAYHRETQRYKFFTPSFETLSAFEVDPSFAIQPWLICTSGENKLWILDAADNTLKKVNARSSEVEVEVVVDSTSIGKVTQFTTMREYQAFVFLLNPEGLSIFNNLGRHIRTLKIPGLTTFNFLGEELYYLKDNHIEFFNLFSTEERRIKVDPGYTHALLTDERMALLTTDRIDIFRFTPAQTK